ncbi:MAG: hypothetical protein ACM32O_09090 [Clostridia bacterium]
MSEINAVLFLAIAIGLPITIHLLTYSFVIGCLCRSEMICRNYQGAKIPTSAGLLIVGSVTITMLCLYVITIPWLSEREAALFLCGSVAMALWGWQDDRSEEPGVKGFRGHFRILWREQRMTSGFLKAWGGFGTALLISLAITQDGSDVVLHTFLLALFTNIINLFDLRPGRAIKVFWLFLLVLVLLTQQAAAWVVWPWELPLLTATLLFYVSDARGKVMLGDSGSNYLGFVLGYYAIIVLDFPVKVALLVLLVVLHLIAERFSFSQVIASVGWLHKMDRLGTIARRSDQER